jgi:hypothetical protein
MDDAEEEQQDDDQPRNAEDPQKQGNHARLLSLGAYLAGAAVTAADARDRAR